MKINPTQIEQFIASQLHSIKVVLVYGPNTGLVSVRAKGMIHKVIGQVDDPFRMATMTFDSIKDDPARLADEMGAISMMGGRRLIRITNALPSLSKPIQEVLEQVKTDALIVIIAGDLPPKSTLRSWCESQPHAAALACYQEEGAALRKVIEDELGSKGYKISADAVTYLQQSFSGDRLQALSEIEKLITYKGSEKLIQLHDAQAVVGDAAEATLDDLAVAVMKGEHAQVQTMLSRLFYEGMQPIAVIRAVLRYVNRLLEARCSIEQGISAKDAIARMKPPIFFKYAPQFQIQIQRWKAATLIKVVRSLVQTEKMCKETGMPAALLCQQILMNIALKANPVGRNV
ncbi:MAG: DNA polymerase III subunit delta [Alphaproteobacteria bacterium]|nr:DNA polymerase III subunit delta [Alphaproteobacteria bacterium]